MDHVPEELWQKLIDTAKKDGVITNTEDSMLDVIFSGLKKYFDAMYQIPSTSNPKELLQKFLQKAHDQSLFDKKIDNN